MNIFDPYGYYQDVKLSGGVYRDSEKGLFIIDDPLSLNLYTYCQNNPIMFQDQNGHSIILTCIIVGAIIGALAGGIAGATISYKKYNEVKWQYVVISAIAGGAAGAALGAAAGYAIEAIGVTASGAIGTGLYKSLEEGVNFTKTTLERMTDPNRYVPVSTLIDAIKNGIANPYPQGTDAIMYTIEMVRNNVTYTLEVLYDEATNTILHFMYYH
jgi:hypothetical protein